MIDPRAFDFLDSAISEIVRHGYDGLQPAMVEVGMALAALDLDAERVSVFVEDYFYQMAAAMLMSSDRAVAHFHEWLSKGANYLQYGDEKGYELEPTKSQWRKAVDGELILPGDPK